MLSESLKNRLEFGCAMLFLAPFVVAGLGALGYGLYQIIEGDADTGDLFPLFAVGSLFTLVGGSFAGAVIAGQRRISEMNRRRAAHPGEPWRWRADWAAGRVRCALPGGMIAFWIFGLAFGGAGVVILANFDEIAPDGAVGYAFLLFPLFGGAMLAAAIYVTLRWIKYGRSECALITNPGLVGGEFQARVRAKLTLAPDDKVAATLTCYHHYVTGAGKSRQVHRDVQWQEIAPIPREEILAEPDESVVVPVAFRIAPSCTPTTPGEPSDRIEWELSLRAEIAGIDFGVEFIVPVFAAA